MRISDWLGGFGLALFLSLPFGMIAALVASLSDRPGKYDPSAGLFTSRDIHRFLIASLVFVVVFTPLCALLGKADRQDAQAFQEWRERHHCIAVTTRTRYTRVYLVTNATTETLYRCDGGEEFWR